MTDMPNITVSELEYLLRSLLDQWGSVDRQFEGKSGTTVPQAVAVLALGAHAHRLALGVLTLREAELYLESIPLTREAYQFALTSQLISQYRSAVSGFLNESDRQRNLTLKTIHSSGWEGAADKEDARQNQGVGERSFTDASARSFETLCQDLQPAGSQAYAIYRVLSSYTHPGYRVVDQYIQAEPLAAFSYPANFTNDDSRPWLYLTCTAVVWAARATDMLDRNHPRRTELRDAAKKLGIPLELQLSESFKKREQKERRERRKER